MRAEMPISAGEAQLLRERRGLLRAPQAAPADLAALQGWYPVATATAPAGLWWRHLGQLPFEHAFFADTLKHQPSAQRQLCFTSWDTLLAPPPAPQNFQDSMRPAAFVFHVSRCGSTLLTQMLSLLPSCVALSEPPVLDDFLRQRRHGASRGNDGDIAMLRALVRALGQRRQPQQQHLVVKLDCWHLQDLALFRAAFPDTPLLFLYRAPLQVLASQRRQPGLQMLPGVIDPAWLADMSAGAARLAPGDGDRYCLHALCAFMAAALAGADAGTPLLLLNYNELPQLVHAWLPDRLGIDCSTAERAAMQARGARHAKHGLPFAGDPPAVAGRGAAPEAALAQRAEQLYAALEARRLAAGQIY